MVIAIQVFQSGQKALLALTIDLNISKYSSGGNSQGKRRRDYQESISDNHGDGKMIYARFEMAAGIIDFKITHDLGSIGITDFFIRIIKIDITDNPVAA